MEKHGEESARNHGVNMHGRTGFIEGLVKIGNEFGSKIELTNGEVKQNLP